MWWAIMGINALTLILGLTILLAEQGLACANAIIGS
jgi:hypothetical protein